MEEQNHIWILRSLSAALVSSRLFKNVKSKKQLHGADLNFLESTVILHATDSEFAVVRLPVPCDARGFNVGCAWGTRGGHGRAGAAFGWE